MKAKLQIEWFKINITKKKGGINIGGFKDPRNQVKYQKKKQERLEEKEVRDPCEIWKNVRDVCTEVEKEVLGRKRKNIRSQSKTVKDLSETQEKIQLDIEDTKGKSKREDLKVKRNKIINTLHK